MTTQEELRDDIEKLEGACLVLAKETTAPGVLAGIRARARTEVLIVLRRMLESKRARLHVETGVY